MQNPSGDSNIMFSRIIESMSKQIYWQLKQMLANFGNTDPEMRTKYLRSFVTRALVELKKLLALAKWVDASSSELLHTTAFHQRLGEIITSLNFSKDQLFYAHCDIFRKYIGNNIYASSKTRSFEVVTAKDILVRGSYAQLPEAISYVAKCKPPTFIPKEVIIKDLDIFIRSKLLLLDPLPSELIGKCSIQNGVLTFGLPRVYELSVTLSHLDESAPWLILDCKILADSHDNERFQGTYNNKKRGLEETVFEVLIKLTEKEEYMDNTAKEKKSLLQDAVSMDISQSKGTISEYEGAGGAHSNSTDEISSKQVYIYISAYCILFTPYLKAYDKFGII